MKVSSDVWNISQDHQGRRVAPGYQSLKSMPLVGTAVVIGLVGYEIKKKGLFKGIVNTALDATPVIGVTKNAIEVITGDWLADKEVLPKEPKQP
ncbi:MAG: hypothetical protein IPJ07_23270 [Acidobacteria bacterium]|nr:hypothetical protein [Acidobacteriota bacterium]